MRRLTAFLFLFTAGTVLTAGSAFAAGSAFTAGPGKSQDFTFKTPDGWTIHATISLAREKNRPLLVAIHGLGGNRYNFPVNRAVLDRSNILRVDMRGHGDSLDYRGRMSVWSDYRGAVWRGAHHDLTGALKFVQNNYGSHIDFNNIFMLGTSYSALMMMVYVPQSPFKKNIRGLIMISGGNTWRINYTAKFRQFITSAHRKPVYILCYRQDDFCSRHHEGMKSAFEKRFKDYKKRPSVFLLEGGGAHGMGAFYSDAARYPALIFSWMQAVMGYNRAKKIP